MKLMGLDVYIYNLSFSCVQVSLYHIIFLCNLGGIFNVDVICQKKKIFTGVKQSLDVVKII